MAISEINNNEFNTKDFLENYWQKKPLVIRSLFPNTLSAISPEELAGLACEEEVESRIVTETLSLPSKSRWDMATGPFEESIFQNMQESHWSLLVQSVDHWNPEVHQLLSKFRFLPAHILDDVMVSFAPNGGSVGPHFDYYDVFLVQGMGARHWKIGQECDENTAVSVNSQLLILDDFQEQQNFLLKTGDVLYLPPKLAHWGIAQEDCITYSIGFRTPSISQSIIAFTDDICEKLNEKERLVFPLIDDPFQIDSSLVVGIKNQIENYLFDDKKLLHWYGCFATEAKNENSILALDEVIDISELIDLLKEGLIIYKNEGSRFIYSSEDSIHLFVDGEYFLVKKEFKDFIKSLCESASFCLKDIENLLPQKQISELLVSLLNKGSLYIEET